MRMGSHTEELLKRLDEQHRAYLETFKLVHEALATSVSSGNDHATPAQSSTPLLSASATGTAATPQSNSTTPLQNNQTTPLSLSSPTTSPRPPIPGNTTPTKGKRASLPPNETLSGSTAADAEASSSKPSTKPSTHYSSIVTGESDASEDDDDLYVQAALPSYRYGDEDLRNHLKSTKGWTQNEETIIGPVIGKGGADLWVAGSRKTGDSGEIEDGEEKRYRSHYSVFDVGTDGAPLERKEVFLGTEMLLREDEGENGEGQENVGVGLGLKEEGSARRSGAGSQKGKEKERETVDVDRAVWMAIRDVNADPNVQRKAVGRITIVREPSPLVLGALHLVMNKQVDMDELFEQLISEDTSQALMTNRSFSSDPRQQRSFVFNFEYYTIVSEGCSPMPWQGAERLLHHSRAHIPISRCSAVVVLVLSGSPIKQIRNAARRAKAKHGYIYDTFAPWQVMNIQCYPDHRHSMDSHDSTKHYVNGPDAFLHTLLAEFRDAGKRFEEINVRIGKLITPPPEIMFDRQLRDALLFEDEDFTYSRRYFWAYQMLGIMNDRLRAILNSYYTVFTEELWTGSHKSIWPLFDPELARNKYWRRRLVSLRGDFEKEVGVLERVLGENDTKRKEIRSLREQLYAGTSVLESRKSVDMAAVTILQGHNIKLLTLVNIFFMPMTFVTSVFGMENFPRHKQFTYFAITMCAVCIPFLFLIGSLNTTSGMRFWRTKWYRCWEYLMSFCSLLKRSSNMTKTNSKETEGFENDEFASPSQHYDNYGGQNGKEKADPERIALKRARTSLLSGHDKWDSGSGRTAMGSPALGLPNRKDSSGTTGGKLARSKTDLLFHSEVILGNHRQPVVDKRFFEDDPVPLNQLHSGVGGGEGQKQREVVNKEGVEGAGNGGRGEGWWKGWSVQRRKKSGVDREIEDV